MAICPTCKNDGAMSLIGEIDDEIFQGGYLCNIYKFNAYVPLPIKVRQHVHRLPTYPGSVSELVDSNYGYLVMAVELDELDEEVHGIWSQVLQPEKNT